MSKTFTGYKRIYDYPSAKGYFTCLKCNKDGALPSNYCTHCGKELEDHQKRGLKK